MKQYRAVVSACQAYYLSANDSDQSQQYCGHRFRTRARVGKGGADTARLVRGGLQYGAVAHIYRERSAEPPEDEARYRHWLEQTSGPEAAGECVPPMDVMETAAGIELVIDLPGVTEAALTVVFSQGALIVAGRKSPGVCAHAQAAFHLAERSFGRFVRAIRLTGAFDAGKATAILSGGELHIRLPRIEERRGRDIRIPVARS